MSFTSILLLEERVALDEFRAILYVSAVVLAGLMVSAFKVPKLVDRWYYVLPAIACLIVAINVARIVG